MVPYDVHRLAVFTASTFILSLVQVSVMPSIESTSSPRPLLLRISMLVGQWTQATVLFWAVVVLCGTPPARDIYHTGLACAYLATLAVITSFYDASNHSTTDTQKQSTSEASHCWQSRLTLPILTSRQKEAANNESRLNFDAQLLSVCQIHGTLFCNIPFQVLRLYDWGSQIQRWPLPIFLGSTYGFVFGSILGCLGIGILRCSPGMANMYQSWINSSALKVNASASNPHQD